MSNSEIEQAISDLYDHSEYLNDWEDDFIKNVRTQWDRKNYLTKEQRDALENLYERKKGKMGR